MHDPRKGVMRNCFDRSGDTVTYNMKCSMKDGTTIEMKGKSTYKGDTFEGNTETTMTAKGQPAMQMSGKMSGKYIGPCVK